MTFPEQGTPPDPSGQAPPAPQKKKEEEGGGGFFSRIKEAAIDNYNGLYVIVLKPRMPEGMLYGMALFGLIFGLLWGWFAAPVQWQGSGPNGLSAESQEQWLKMVAVGTSPNNLYGPDQIVSLAQQVPNPRAQIEQMLADETLNSNDRAALQMLLSQLPATADAESAESINNSGNILSVILGAWVFPIVLMIIFVVVITLLWRFLIYDNLVAPVLQRIKEIRDPEERERSRRSREELETVRRQRDLREELAKQSKGSALGDPAMTQLAIYTPGRMFDESYEIELESGEFLGQSGTVIAESVDPDPVAIEVWLFDMFSSKNIAKVFVTPQGNADPAIRSKLEASVDNPATDIVVANIGTPLHIDTDKLRLEAKFASLNFNANGRFENFNLQMLAWNKDGNTAATPIAPTPQPIAPAGAPDMSVYDNITFDPPPPASPSPAGAPDMSTYDNITFDPPPPMPSSGSSPAGAPDMSTYDNITFDPPPPMPSSGSSLPPITPLSPPPLRPSDDNEDDDPFGGTGDFTPLGGV